jgi:uncharacterized protein (DUF2336 family)
MLGAQAGTNARIALIQELDSALKRQSDDGRADILRRVTELFLSTAGRCDNQQIQLFDEVMLRLIERVESRELVEIGEQLASAAKAPAGAIGLLARRDDIAVAAPVLARSERLGQTDLVDIAETKGQDHLLAICRRTRLDIPVTDVLLRRGNADVVRSLAANRGAKFSDVSFAALFELVNKDEIVAERLVQRGELPQHLLHRMLLRASETLRQRLLTVAPPDMQDEIRRTLDEIARDIVTDEVVAESAASRIQAQHEQGKLKEPDLLNFAQAKKSAETTAALSLLCTVPHDVVEQLMADERIEPVLILCKAADFEWTTVRAIVQLRPRSRETTAGGLTEICENYRKLQPASARQVLNYWQSRGPGR